MDYFKYLYLQNKAKVFLIYTMAEEQMDTVLGLDVKAVENKGEKWMYIRKL